MIASQPPYALATATFPFRALATLAGRAALGGPREVAMAAFLAARLAQDALPPHALSPAIRATRAGAARTWLSSLALPAGVRPPLARLVDATAAEPAGIAAALRNVIPVIAGHLDPAALSELERLAQRLVQ